MTSLPNQSPQQASGNPMDATRQNIFNALKTTYWEAAHGEICNMILFFGDVLDQGRKVDNFLAMDFEEMKCDNFTKMFELWLGGQRQSWEGFDTSELYEETIERARERISVNNLPTSELLARKLHILARRLLQSSSFLDIDVFYEPAIAILPSFGQALPSLERTEIPATDSTFRCTAVRAMRCAGCSTLIRTETYLECMKGCPDSTSKPLAVRLIDDRGSTIYQDLPSGALGHPPLRLCLVCNLQNINLGSCSRDHLQRQSIKSAKNEANNNPKAKEDRLVGISSRVKRTFKDILLPNRAEQVFQKALSNHEDEEFLQERGAGNHIRLFSSIFQADQILEPTQTPFAWTSMITPQLPSGSTVLQSISGTAKLLRSKVTPAGAYHLSLRFGTVVIESGVDKLKIAGKEYATKRGILVSPRFSPTMLPDKKSASVLLQDLSDRLELEEDGQVIRFGTCCNLYLAKDNKDRYKRRCVELIRRPIVEKSGLACMKVVYGAAFSGYPDSKKGGEEATIEALVNEARSFYQSSYRSKTIDAQRQALCKSADRVLKALQYAIEDEVNKYLDRLVTVFLHPDTKITWSALSNNCQHLVDALLRGKDFEYFFPRLPKQPKSGDDSTLDVDWPQYLMSFSDRIDGEGVSLHQPHSLLTRYFSKTRFGGDLVDFLDIQIQANDASRKYAVFLLKRGAMADKNNRIESFNAMWEMPRDTLSILQFHLSRDQSRYVSSAGGKLNDADWVENRLLLLLLSDIFSSLSGALGASLLKLVTSNSDLVSRIVLPKARVLGTARLGERVRILQLPGKQVVYFIATKIDDELEKLFEAPENDVHLITKIIRKYYQQPQALPSMLFPRTMARFLEIFFETLQGERIHAKRGFKSSSRSSGGDLVSLAINQTIRMHEIRRRDGWVHLDLGGFTMVLQLFRKSKTVRQVTTKRIENLIKGSSGNETGS
ncbi:hypothetical protein F5Y10DRAFT_227211 [Nemania abortiva]|nr:hypothetical protein F5Y10DRAFT_227211 [Nemania abortiva]